MAIPYRYPASVLVLAAATVIGIANHESYRETAYIPVPGDVPTIGYGSTKGVKLGDKTNPARALKRLGEEAESVYAAGVRKCVTVPLTPGEFGSFVSLSYSIGTGAFCRKAIEGHPPNLIDLINAGQYEAACDRIEAFKYGPGRKVLPGLVKRRAEERRVCRGEQGNTGGG